MGWYLEPVLESHDRDRFEIFCYANVEHPDGTTQHIQQLAGHWRNILHVPDDEVEKMIHQDQIDLLLDMSGHTGGNRLSLFSCKPAPVQASHFGYMDTSGLSTIDFRISDAFCDPPGWTERYHTERLVRLPEIL
jgi:protein O-GlcNAc transferase